MKTLTFIILFAGIFAACNKDMDVSPDRSGTGQLAKKSNGISISLFKEGVLLDQAETNFSPNPIDNALEPFDRDITISFLSSGAFWQVINAKPRKGDTLSVSILHKEQAWCSHCSYFNGNYMIEVSSKMQASLVDKTLGITKPVNKNKTITYNYAVTDDSEQNNRFIIIIR